MAERALGPLRRFRGNGFGAVVPGRERCGLTLYALSRLVNHRLQANNKRGEWVVEARFPGG